MAAICLLLPKALANEHKSCLTAIGQNRYLLGLQAYRDA